MKICLIYHKEDCDGVFSGALCEHFIQQSFPSVDITHMPVNYAQLADMLMVDYDNNADRLAIDFHSRFDIVIMTDISFNNITVMKSLYKEFKDNLFWFDHHAPIIKLSYKQGFDSIQGIRNTKFSAIMCVWKYFKTNETGPITDAVCNHGEIPELLLLLSAYDSFNWEGHDVSFDECNYCTLGVEQKSDLDIKLAAEIIQEAINNPESVNKFIELGKLIAEYKQVTSTRSIKEFGDCDFLLDGKYGPVRKACVIFGSGRSSSLDFASLQDTDIRNGIVFKKVKGTSNWIVSLYNINKEDDDVFHAGNYMRKRYKGGGHAGAAGATISHAQFNRIMKSKRL